MLKASEVAGALFVLAAIFVAAPYAFAQSIGAVANPNLAQIDPNPIVQNVLSLIVLAIGVVFAWAKSKIPDALREWLEARTQLLEQERFNEVVEKMMGWGYARTVGARRLEPFSVDVGNAFVARSLEYGYREFTDFMRKHGARKIEAAIIARLDFERDVAVGLAEEEPVQNGFVAPDRARAGV